MHNRNDETVSTYVLGQRALDEMKARYVQVTPRNFELWYIHVAGTATNCQTR